MLKLRVCASKRFILVYWCLNNSQSMILGGVTGVTPPVALRGGARASIKKWHDIILENINSNKQNNTHNHVE